VIRQPQLLLTPQQLAQYNNPQSPVPMLRRGSRAARAEGKESAAAVEGGGEAHLAGNGDERSGSRDTWSGKADDRQGGP
jgi:hypothetical protein